MSEDTFSNDTTRWKVDGFPRITAEPPSLVGEQNSCFPNWLVSSQGAMEYDGTYFHLQVC